jgi:hypothetical protein
MPVASELVTNASVKLLDVEDWKICVGDVWSSRTFFFH